MNGIAVPPASDSSTASLHSLAEFVVLTNEGTNPNVATIGCTIKGIEFQPIDAGSRGRLPPVSNVFHA
jgi:hypothetical protein